MPVCVSVRVSVYMRDLRSCLHNCLNNRIISIKLCCNTMAVYHISHLHMLINNVSSRNIGNEIETILTAGTKIIRKFYWVMNFKI
jgi:hypothetical protein